MSLLVTADLGAIGHTRVTLPWPCPATPLTCVPVHVLGRAEGQDWGPPFQAPPWARGAGWALARSSVLGDIPGRQSGTAARGAGRGGPSALSASEPTHCRRVLLGPPARSRRGAWEAPGPRRGDRRVWCWHVQAAADPAVPVAGEGALAGPRPQLPRGTPPWVTESWQPREPHEQARGGRQGGGWPAARGCLARPG